MINNGNGLKMNCQHRIRVVKDKGDVYYTICVKCGKRDYALRDQYAIPSVKVCTGKSVTTILKEEDLLPKWPEDIMNLFRKAVKLRKHL